MAQYTAIARSNYFHVKDVAAFEDDMANYEVEVWHRDDDFVGLTPTTEYGSWPDGSYNEDMDEYHEIDFPAIVATHLVADSVAIFMEIGNEKLRFVRGVAEAINAAGERAVISLDDIYEAAKNLGSEVSFATY